jgi:hypothetical protein
MTEPVGDADRLIPGNTIFLKGLLLLLQLPRHHDNNRLKHLRHDCYGGWSNVWRARVKGGKDGFRDATG